MTLTEFLLARIDEDKAQALAGDDEWDIPTGVAYAGVGMGSDRYRVHTIDPRRILAECEAKRRIVDCVHVLMGLSQSRRHDDAADGLLYALALPYAGHPDYDPSWAV